MCCTNIIKCWMYKLYNLLVQRMWAMWSTKHPWMLDIIMQSTGTKLVIEMQLFQTHENETVYSWHCTDPLKATEPQSCIQDIAIPYSSPSTGWSIDPWRRLLIPQVLAPAMMEVPILFRSLCLDSASSEAVKTKSQRNIKQAMFWLKILIKHTDDWLSPNPVGIAPIRSCQHLTLLLTTPLSILAIKRDPDVLYLVRLWHVLSSVTLPLFSRGNFTLCYFSFSLRNKDENVATAITAVHWQGMVPSTLL